MSSPCSSTSGLASPRGSSSLATSPSEQMLLLSSPGQFLDIGFTPHHLPSQGEPDVFVEHPTTSSSSPAVSPSPSSTSLSKPSPSEAEFAVRRATELVASSLVPLVAQAGPTQRAFGPRVLIFGRDSDQRALYLAEHGFFSPTVGSPLFEFEQSGVDASERHAAARRHPRASDAEFKLAEGIYWITDLRDFEELDDASFNAVVIFNTQLLDVHEDGMPVDAEELLDGGDEDIELLSSQSGASIPMAYFMQQAARVLMPGGYVTGTGVFLPHNAPHGASIDYARTAGSLSSFRNVLEGTGLAVHVAMDMALEGNVLVTFEPDPVSPSAPQHRARRGSFPSSPSASFSPNTTHDVVCARFLASKPVMAPVTVVSAANIRRFSATSLEALHSVLTALASASSLPVAPASPAAPLTRSRSPPLRPTSSPPDPARATLARPPGVPATPDVAASAAAPVSASAQSLPTGASTNSTPAPSSGLSGRVMNAKGPEDSKKSSRRHVMSETADNTMNDEFSRDGLVLPRVVVSGVSLGLPNAASPDQSCTVFDRRNFARVFAGENCISQLTKEEKSRIIGQNVVQVLKVPDTTAGARAGAMKRVRKRLTNTAEVIQLASKLGHFDLAGEYGVPSYVVQTLDTTYQLAMAAGLEALEDAGIELDPKTRSLPESMQDCTGVIFASSFPCMDSCVREVKRKWQAVAALEAARASKLEKSLHEAEAAERSDEDDEEISYEFDRKLLFKLLVMANNQLAELINARGPNTHVNAACASTSQAVAIAEDWIRLGRCSRVIVVSADNSTSDDLLPYIGTGFLALTAASTAPTVATGALPFDRRRNGMILGMGAAGLVLESLAAARARNARPKVELLASHFVNSAFHASLLDRQHISSELASFLTRVESQFGIDRRALAEDCVYFSHETFTCAKGGCAKAETDALSLAFGEEAKSRLLIANTKGLTGHPMGVGLEDVIAVASLDHGLVPPVPNLRHPDPVLGTLNLSRGGSHTRKYALRFSAGFGSQFVFLLMKKWEESEGQEPLLMRVPPPPESWSWAAVSTSAAVMNADEDEFMMGMDDADDEGMPPAPLRHDDNDDRFYPQKVHQFYDLGQQLEEDDGHAHLLGHRDGLAEERPHGAGLGAHAEPVAEPHDHNNNHHQRHGSEPLREREYDPHRQRRLFSFMMSGGAQEASNQDAGRRSHADVQDSCAIM